MESFQAHLGHHERRERIYARSNGGWKLVVEFSLPFRPKNAGSFG